MARTRISDGEDASKAPEPYRPEMVVTATPWSTHYQISGLAKR